MRVRLQQQPAYVFSGFLIEMIRHQFEVDKYRIVWIGRQLVEEELQDLQAGFDV